MVGRRSTVDDAPFAFGDDDDWVTHRLRIEGLLPQHTLLRQDALASRVTAVGFPGSEGIATLLLGTVHGHRGAHSGRQARARMEKVRAAAHVAMH